MLTTLSLFFFAPEAHALTFEASRPVSIDDPGVYRQFDDPILNIDQPQAMNDRVRQVVLDACEGRRPGSTFTWEAAILQGSDVEPELFELSIVTPPVAVSDCRVTWQVPFEGSWKFTVTEDIDPTTTADDVSDIEFLDVRDIWIASLGDSYSSGEGAADTFHPTGPAFLGFGHQGCHRSQRAWPTHVADAVEAELQATNDGWMVLYSHLACSGAELADGILEVDEYRGPEAEYGDLLVDWVFDQLGQLTFPYDAPSQLDQLTEIRAASLTPHAPGPIRPDVVLVSGGGNDIGFADIAVACMYMPDDSCEEEMGRFQLDFSANLEFDRVEDLYAELGDGLLQRQLHPDRPRTDGSPADLGVMLLEYPDPSTGDEGEPEACAPVSGGITDAGMAFAQEGIFMPLNGAVEDAADAHGWSYLDGPEDAFQQHGLCATDNWIMTLPESLAVQGTTNGFPSFHGTLHPNITGNAEIAAAVEQEVIDHVQLLDESHREPSLRVQLREASTQDPLPGSSTTMYRHAVHLTTTTPADVAAEVYVDGVLQPSSDLITLQAPPPGMGGPVEIEIRRFWTRGGTMMPAGVQTYTVYHNPPGDLLDEIEITATTATGRSHTFGRSGEVEQDGGAWFGSVAWSVDLPDQTAFTTEMEVRAMGADPSPYVAGTLLTNSGHQGYLLTVRVLDTQGRIQVNRVVPFEVAATPDDWMDARVPAIDVYAAPIGLEAPTAIIRRVRTSGTYLTDYELPAASWSVVRFGPEVTSPLEIEEYFCTDNNQITVCESVTAFPAPAPQWAVHQDGSFVASGLVDAPYTWGSDYALTACVNPLADCVAGNFDPDGSVVLDTVVPGSDVEDAEFQIDWDDSESLDDPWVFPFGW